MTPVRLKSFIFGGSSSVLSFFEVLANGVFTFTVLYGVGTMTTSVSTGVFFLKVLLTKVV